MAVPVPGAPQGNWYTLSPARAAHGAGRSTPGLTTGRRTPSEPKVLNSPQDDPGRSRSLRSTAAPIDIPWSVGQV
ncbi:polymorphic toxin type 46 domain-containing protein [Pseudomonas aeruginosa]